MANKNISIIAAVARNGAIGLNNKLLYWLPNDMKRFKALTTGNTIKALCLTDVILSFHVRRHPIHSLELNVSGHLRMH